MARKSDIVPAKQKRQAVEDENTTAMANTLGFATDVATGKAPAGAATRLSGLAALCDQAADHMALAHNLLVTHEGHTDTAIEHLDSALGCLKELVAEGERRQLEKTSKMVKKTRRQKTA